jgi:choline kinase
MIAVVLAAGKGSRLGNFTVNLPKSLLPLNDKNETLLDYNLGRLQEMDLKKIIIVTGFNSLNIEHHISKYKNIEIIYNPFWNYCNVLGSLYLALDSIKDDFLFLHADTLADKEIWDMLIATKGEMELPFQRKKCGEEEMKVRLQGDTIIEISKEIDSAKADGEFLGIAKFEKITVPFFKSKSEELFKQGDLNHYMESIIQAAINENKFHIKAMDILNHNFVEVDFEEDYIRAKAEFGNQ